MKKDGKILVVDDNENVRTALKLLLSKFFNEVILISSPNSILHKLDTYCPDIVLLDMNFSSGINTGNEGLFWLREIKKHSPNTPVVLFTAYADIELAVTALKEGAADFVVKPWDNAKLLATLNSARLLNQSRKEVKRLKEREQALNIELSKDEDVCWGESLPMAELKNTIEKVAKTNANILITGENGTGKEVVARMVHNLSKRANGPLVTVDMAAIVETLFESEMFGHAKGSFTDAKEHRIGKFEVADKGTLFLDEIGNLDIGMQAKLLSALQTRTVTRVGSNASISINIRLICATNSNLVKAVSNGEFREDLYYRINTIELYVPPLRNRISDIPLLAEFFLNRYSMKYHKRDLVITESAMLKLKQYYWPGNVRELQHAIEKAVILADDKVLDSNCFMLKEEDTSSSNDSLEGLSLEEMEIVMIKNALNSYDGNISAVALELGITRPTLYSKMKRYNL